MIVLELQSVQINNQSLSGSNKMKVNTRNAKSIERSDQNKIAYELQRERIKILDRKKKQYETYIMELKEQIRMQDQQLFALDDEVNHYKTEIQRLRQQLRIKQQETLRIEEYVQLIERLREQKHFLNQKMHSLKYELKEQQNKCYELNHQNEVLSSRLQKLSKEVQQLKLFNSQHIILQKKPPIQIEVDKPLVQHELLELSFQHFQLNEEIRKYEKNISQLEYDDRIKRKEKAQKIEQLRSKIFLMNSKLYNIKQKIDQYIQDLGIENYGVIAQQMLLSHKNHKQNNEKRNIDVQSLVKNLNFSEASERSQLNLQNYHEALFNHLNENEKIKKAKDEAIANILQEFEYTKKNLNVYRDKNLLQEKVIENQRQNIQELRKLVQEAQLRKQDKKQQRQKLEFIARELSKSSPAVGQKFSKLLSNLAKGRVLDIQKQFHSLNTQEAQKQSISSSQAYGPSNHDQDIMVSNVHKWSASRGVEQLHPHQLNKHQLFLRPQHKKTYFTQNKNFLRRQQQQQPIVGTAIDALASHQGSRQHHHHNFIVKKTSFDQQLVPVDIENSYQFIKSEKVFENPNFQSQNISYNLKQPKIAQLRSVVQNQINQVIYDNSSVRIDNLSQEYHKQSQQIPISQDVVNSFDLD